MMNTTVMIHLASGIRRTMGASRGTLCPLPEPVMINIISNLVPSHNANALYRHTYMHTLLLGQRTSIEVLDGTDNDTSHIMDTILEFLYPEVGSEPNEAEDDAANRKQGRFPAYDRVC